MSNPYVGSKITGCNSPAIGNDRSTYSGVIDAAMQAIDNHDHTSGKGTPIGTAGIADAAITAAKMAALAVSQGVLALLSVGTPQLIDAAVTTQKMAAPNRVDGGFVSAYSTASNPVNEDVVGLSVTITVSLTGGKVKLRLANVGSPLSPASLVGSGVTLTIRDTGNGNSYAAGFSGTIPPSAIVMEDYNPTAGAHTYQVTIASATGIVNLNNLRLVAEETR